MRRGLGFHARHSPGGFNPGSLFTGGIQGAWYDPSDLTTLFQDSAGTTPVTAVEQPVGLMLDKSGRGNHAFQTTSASRPTLRARYNLLTYSEQFDNAAWTKQASSVTANAAVAPDGTTTADKLIENATTNVHYIETLAGVSVVSGVQYSFTLFVKAAERAFLQLATNSTGWGVNQGVNVNLSTGASQIVSGTPTVSVTDVGNGWYRVSLTATATSSATTNINYVIVTSISAPLFESYAGNGTSGIFIWGAQLTTPAVFPSNTYQRIGASTDYATGAAFPPYLFFDGIDDSMLTNSVDFSGTDKMLVVAGVTKQSDAAAGIVAELSANGDSNNGAFYVSAAAGAASNYATAMRGTSLGYYLPATFAAPITNVVSMIGDIAQSTLATEIVPRINGTVVQTGGVGGSGTGNFGNYPLYIGRRNNATLPLNGSLFSLIIAGQSYAAGQITSTEQWVAAKTPLGTL